RNIVERDDPPEAHPDLMYLQQCLIFPAAFVYLKICAPSSPDRSNEAARIRFAIPFTKLAERESASTPSNMMTHKEIFAQMRCTHIATHTRNCESSGWRLSAQELSFTAAGFEPVT